MTTSVRWNDYDNADSCRSRSRSFEYSRGFSQNLIELIGGQCSAVNCIWFAIKLTAILRAKAFRGQILWRRYAYVLFWMRASYRSLWANLKNVPFNAPAFYGVHEFLNMRTRNISERLFQSCFNLFSRHSFSYPDTFIEGIVYLYNKYGMTYITACEPISEMCKPVLPIDKYGRKFRGMVFAMDTGLGMLASHMRFTTGSFNFIAPVPSFENNYW